LAASPAHEASHQSSLAGSTTLPDGSRRWPASSRYGPEDGSSGGFYASATWRTSLSSASRASAASMPRTMPCKGSTSSRFPAWRIQLGPDLVAGIGPGCVPTVAERSEPRALEATGLGILLTGLAKPPSSVVVARRCEPLVALAHKKERVGPQEVIESGPLASRPSRRGGRCVTRSGGSLELGSDPQ
jgi:hypothetical protein